MQLPIDDRILEILDFTDLVLSPSIIAYNIGKSREEVSRRLAELVDKGFVSRVERGKYEIEVRGSEYLNGNLDASQFDEEGNDDSEVPV